MGLSFETAPSVSLWSVLLKRGGGGPIPRIEAQAERLTGDVAAYAALTGFTRRDALPITWPNVLLRGLQMAVLTSPEFPLKLMGIVHVRQHITQLRAIRPDEALSGACWVEGHRAVRSGGEFDVHSEVRAGGEAVWRGVTTILSRDIPGDGVKRPSLSEPPFTIRRSVCWRLPADLGRRYAAVSGDINPIHLHPWTARPFGFRKPIVHGWWSLARCLAELDREVPDAAVVEARFRAPVPLPGAVTFESGPSERGARFELRRAELCLSGEVRPLT